MSDVVKFPLQHNGAPRRRPDDTSLSLANLVEGAMSFDALKQRFPLHLNFRQKHGPAKRSHSERGYDWTNQELATLFRISRILNLAELTIETDRGISDEGDPWFVFLDPKGEVFAHLCRIGSKYMLDSPSQSAVVEGRSLNDLVDAYVQQKGVAQTNKPEERKNIIQLVGENNRKVTVHPAAALAALIWTIYLQSDELGASVLSDDHGSPEAAPADDMDSALFYGITSEEISALSPAEENALLLANARMVLDVDPDHSEKSTSLPMPLNYAGMGLSALALTYGLEPFISGIAQEDKLPGSGTFSKKGAVQESAQQSLEDMLLSLSGTGLEFLQDFGAHAESLWAAISDVGLLDGEVNTAEVQIIASELIEAMMATASLLTPTKFSEGTGSKSALVVEGDRALSSNKLAQEIGLGDQVLKDSKTIINLTESPVEVDDLQVMVLPPDLAAVLAKNGFSTTGSVVVNLDAGMAEAYLPELEAVLDDGEAEGSLSDESAYDKYDQSVSDFISFLMLNSEDIQMVSYATELVIIDEAALSLDSSLTYTKSWELDDGGRISTIGLKADFEAFDLIA